MRERAVGSAGYESPGHALVRSGARARVQPAHRQKSLVTISAQAGELLLGLLGEADEHSMDTRWIWLLAAAITWHAPRASVDSAPMT